MNVWLALWLLFAKFFLQVFKNKQLREEKPYLLGVSEDSRPDLWFSNNFSYVKLTIRQTVATKNFGYGIYESQKAAKNSKKKV